MFSSTKDENKVFVNVLFFIFQTHDVDVVICEAKHGITFITQ